MSVLIKICGLKTSAALDVALGAGADLVGFVFFPPSPRHLDFAGARALAIQVRGRAQKVALSVDASDEWLASSIDALHPDMLNCRAKNGRNGSAGSKKFLGFPSSRRGLSRMPPILRPSPPMRPWPIAFCLTPGLHARQRGPADSAKVSTGTCSKTSISVLHS